MTRKVEHCRHWSNAGHAAQAAGGWHVPQASIRWPLPVVVVVVAVVDSPFVDASIAPVYDANVALAGAG